MAAWLGSCWLGKKSADWRIPPLGPRGPRQLKETPLHDLCELMEITFNNFLLVLFAKKIF